MILREIRRPLKRKAPRNAAALTVCRRGELADSFCPHGRPSAAFLAALRSVDNRLEPYWHPVKDRWFLYRKVREGITPRDDVLMKELPVCGPRGEYRPLGQWLIDKLRKNDMTRNGSVDPGYAGRKYLSDLMAHNQEFEAAKERQEDEIAHRFAKDVERYAVDCRRSQALPKGTSNVVKNKGRRKRTR